MAILSDINYRGFSLGNAYINLKNYSVRRGFKVVVDRIDGVNTRIESKVYQVNASFNLYSNSVTNTLTGEALDTIHINYETDLIEETTLDSVWTKLKEIYPGTDV